MLTEQMGLRTFLFFSQKSDRSFSSLSFAFSFSLGMSFGLFRNLFPRKNQPQISEISTPISVTKNLHVSYDPTTKTFHGLPPEWEEQVKSLFTYVSLVCSLLDVHAMILLIFSHSKPEDKARVMTCALKVIQQTMRENRKY